MYYAVVPNVACTFVKTLFIKKEDKEIDLDALRALNKMIRSDEDSSNFADLGNDRKFNLIFIKEFDDNSINNHINKEIEAKIHKQGQNMDKDAIKVNQEGGGLIETVIKD